MVTRSRMSADDGDHVSDRLDVDPMLDKGGKGEGLEEGLSDSDADSSDLDEAKDNQKGARFADRHLVLPTLA